MKRKVIAGIILVACIMCSITACKKKESNISWNHMNDTDTKNNTVTGESDIVKNITSQLQLVVSDSEYSMADSKEKERLLGEAVVNLYEQNLIEPDYTKNSDGYELSSVDSYKILVNYDGTITLK